MPTLSLSWLLHLFSFENPPRHFHYRGSWVTSLHGNIFFWSEKYIYTINETNSPLNTPCVSPYLWHFAGNRIQGHHCSIFTLNMKRVQVCIDYYIIQICPNTGFIPALIYQTLHCLLPRFFNFFPPFFFSKARVAMNNWTVPRSKCHSRGNCLLWLVIRISLFVM